MKPKSSFLWKLMLWRRAHLYHFHWNLRFTRCIAKLHGPSYQYGTWAFSFWWGTCKYPKPQTTISTIATATCHVPLLKRVSWIAVDGLTAHEDLQEGETWLYPLARASHSWWDKWNKQPPHPMGVTPCSEYISLICEQLLPKCCLEWPKEVYHKIYY